MLSTEQVRRFVDDGYVHLESAFSPDLARRCREEIWAAVEEDPDDPATWTRPVARLEGFATEPFRTAVDTPALHEAFDQLVGPGRWLRRESLGTIPVRFPVDVDPGDDGWHIDASFVGERGEPRVVPASSRRPEALATGRAGDVYLCHPFLVHAAQRHHGTRPRAIAQPPLHPVGPIDLSDAALPPIAAAITRALATS